MFKCKTDLRKFLLAGEAVVTIKSLRSGEHLTLRFRHTENRAGAYFIDALRGPDNTRDYVYVAYCSVNGGGALRLRKVVEGSALRAHLEWFLDAVWSEEDGLFRAAEVRHAGRCGRCGRLLTTPESIDTGLGPTCSGRG